MKITDIFLIFFLFFLYTTLAFAGEEMVIIFKDGRSQRVTLMEPACSIKSINFGGTSSASTSSSTPSTSSTSSGTPTSTSSTSTSGHSKPATIKVVSATYGANCGTRYNVARVSRDCDGKPECSGIITNDYAGHDPAPGCGKDFTIVYTCGDTSKKAYVPGKLREGGRWSLTCP